MSLTAAGRVPAKYHASDRLPIPDEPHELTV
jgi:hypothetical protein